MYLNSETGSELRNKLFITMAGIKTRQAGFSLTELMIAITLGLLVMAGVAAVFSSSVNIRNENERASRGMENGQYALWVLSEDFENAGYYAEFDPNLPPSLSPPAAKPDPCDTAANIILQSQTTPNFLALPVQGYGDGAAVTAIATSITCQPILSDVKAGTDILVVRRASTCVAGSTNCDAPAAGAYTYFQAALCDNAGELNSLNSVNYYRLDTNPAILNGTQNCTTSTGYHCYRTQRDCTTPAAVHRYRTHIYFIANNDSGGDGIPTLKRAELGPPSDSCSTPVGDYCVVPLAEGVENLQVEYGIDTTIPTADGVPDIFAADPDAYGVSQGCDTTTAITCVGYWQRVVSANVHLLVRNTERSLGLSDTKTYTLGLKADGTAYTVGPFNDGYKRHVYQTAVRLNNSASRY